MLRKLIPAVGLAALMGASGLILRADQLKVTGVRFWTFEATTRVAIELSDGFEYHVERLHNPERIFFDFKAKLGAEAGKPITNVDDKLVRRIRVAETKPGVSRIVLDLNVPAEYTASQLANPDRLMIELRAGATPAIPTISESPGMRSAPATAVTAPPVAPSPMAPPPMAPPPIEKPMRAPAVAANLPEPPTTVLESRKPAAPPTPAETAQAARRSADGHSSLTRALGLKVTRVVIDPGHGGRDQGTTGPHGLLEKDLVLDVALRLGKLIETTMGSEVIYTRADDTFIPLSARTELANDKKADLFISIHANSSPYPAIRGVETYYLNLTNSKDSLDVAAFENKSSDKSVFELRDLIQQITMHEKIDESKEFANRIQMSLQMFERTYSPASKNRGIKKAPFVVLIGANMPSVLAEIGFISNAKEEALLNKPEHRQKLADALYRGVSKYAQSLSHFQVAQVGEDRQ